jgi:uncharacterized protein (DUF305 family)
MKKILLLLAVSILGLACSQSANVNTNMPMNHSQMNHSQMNHGEMNNNSAPMNHSEMNHSGMKSAPNAANAPYDLQFLDTMIAHHQGAVDMANLAMTNTNNADLKKFSTQIIADQTKEIKQMKDWREKWFSGKPSAMNMEMTGMHESMQMEMSALAKARDKDFDLEFVRGMVPHHEGAIAMAREALTKAEHAEIRQLANEIIKAQEAEIKMMKNWKTA